MRKFWALLLTLAMVMQLVALPVVAEESVTTPTDVTWNCVECINHPQSIKLTWTVDATTLTHVMKCAHGVALENTRHEVTYDASSEPIFVDEWIEVYNCTGFSGCTRPVSVDHRANCTNPNVCESCGMDISGMGFGYYHVGYEYKHDEIQHWRVCKGCGDIEWKDYHDADCTNPDVCKRCDATDVYISDIHINHHNVEMKYDETSHWYECLDCKQIIQYSVDAHRELCTDLGVCYECGATGVTFAELSHWNVSEYFYDNDYHWQECLDCGEKIWNYTHEESCVNPGVCVECGATNVSFSDDIAHNIDWGNPEHNSTIHWFVCIDCHEKVHEEEHIPAKTDPSFCAICLTKIAPQSTTEPTDEPTTIPIATPTQLPTTEPTIAPTPKPTEQATAKPTDKPTEQVTAKPTEKLTEQATAKPTKKPTEQPTAKPTDAPTKKPTPVHTHTYPETFTTNNDGTHSKACLGNCGKKMTESCQLVTTDVGMMTCTACATCGYAVYTAKEGVAALNVGEQVPATVVTIEKASIASAEEGKDVLPKGALLVVHETTFDLPVALSTELKGTVEKVFTAALVKDGQTIQPTGKVKLTIPMDEEALAQLEGKVLMLLREDGTLVEIAYEIVDGQLVFLTDSLGVFLLMNPEA